MSETQSNATKKDLSNYDFILLLDKSGSMATTDMPGGKSRWAAAKETTLALAAKCAEYDKDGITVIPFAGSHKEYKNVTAGVDKVNQIFEENEPSSSTNTAGVLEHVLNGYFTNPAKPIIVLCITDGKPDSQEHVEKVIIEATKKMKNDGEIGLSFIQIGNDPGARDFLKTLDDGLEAKGAKFDIVDTKTTEEMEGMTLTDVVLAALND